MYICSHHIVPRVLHKTRRNMSEATEMSSERIWATFPEWVYAETVQVLSFLTDVIFTLPWFFYHFYFV